MSDDTGLAEALLGLEGFKVLEVTETEAEVTIRIEIAAMLVAYVGCGLRAEAQDRTVVQYRNLAAFGWPARLAWNKRRWRWLSTRPVQRRVYPRIYSDPHNEHYHWSNSGQEGDLGASRRP